MPHKLQVAYRSEHLRFDGISADLSAVGALVLTPLCDLPGTDATLTLGSGGASVSLTCQVVRVSRGDRPGMAVRFTTLAPDVRLWLAQLGCVEAA